LLTLAQCPQIRDEQSGLPLGAYTEGWVLGAVCGSQVEITVLVLK